MARLLRHEVNFLGNRRVFYAISLSLIAMSVLAVIFVGLNFGIEFSGGTSTTFTDTGDITTEQMRSAFDEVGDNEAVIQTTDTNGEPGFLVRTTVTDPDVAADHASRVAESFGLPSNSYQVSTIGPDWGRDVINRALIAFIVSIIAIVIYIAIRFEYKMGVTAIIALLHDLVIVVGIYAITGRQINPNVIAALLTIMGYSLYDTVVVFHRITDNATHGEIRTSFWKLANHSINQVFTRTVNTTLTSLLPVICMLFFGGQTLTDFAFAMTIGLITGSYSSIAIASPLYTAWKSREPKYARMNKRHPDDLLTKREIRKRLEAGIPLVDVDESDLAKAAKNHPGDKAQGTPEASAPGDGKPAEAGSDARPEAGGTEGQDGPDKETEDSSKQGTDGSGKQASGKQASGGSNQPNRQRSGSSRRKRRKRKRR